MTERSPSRTNGFATFLLVTLGVYATGFAITQWTATYALPREVYIGLTLDMVVLVPTTYYVLIIRRRLLPITSLAAILAVNFIAAHLLIPNDHKTVLSNLQLAMAPIELGLIGWIVMKSISSLRSIRQNMDDDPLTSLTRAAIDILQHRILAGVFASEVGSLYYGLASFKRKPHVPNGYVPFTHHEKCGHAGLTFAAIFLVLAETTVVHIWIEGWSPLVAWLLTATSVYTALWLFADYRATILRPILIDRGEVIFRAGLRWTITVPLDQVLELTRVDPCLGKSCINLQFITSPTQWIILSSPVMAIGPYGIQKEVLAVAFEMDDSASFEVTLKKSLDPARS